MEKATSRIVRCTGCGAANRIPADRVGTAAKCGKCGLPLPTEEKQASPDQMIKMRCTECGTKNRIPAAKIVAGPKCGKCGALLKTEELSVPQPVMVTDSNFDSKVLKSPLPVLLFAWAPWCSGCRAVTPIIDEFATESKGKIRVGKLNVDANPMLASKFNILSVPFLFIFDNGQMRESMPGGLQKHDLMTRMAQYI